MNVIPTVLAKIGKLSLRPEDLELERCCELSDVGSLNSDKWGALRFIPPINSVNISQRQYFHQIILSATWASVDNIWGIFQLMDLGELEPSDVFDPTLEVLLVSRSVMDNWEIEMLVEQEQCRENGDLEPGRELALLRTNNLHEVDILVLLFEVYTDWLNLFAIPTISHVDLQETPFALLYLGLQLVDTGDTLQWLGEDKKGDE